MAVAYESVQTSNSGTTDVTVTKPVSLAVGDFMVAHLASSNASGADLSAHTASGWTQIATDQSQSGTASHRATALYKVATSGDVSASDFTFTCDADSESSTGAIYRFTGVGDVSGAADDDPSTGTSHTFTNTVTPTFANSVMVFLASCVNNGGTTWSDYAITTNNPTWTERYDITNTGAASDGDTTMAGATASRPETSATGDSSATSGGSVSDSVGILVVLYPQVNVSVTGSTGLLVLNGNAGTVNGSANITGSTGILTLTGNAGTFSSPTPDWRNTDKSSAPSWVNPDKS